MSDASERVPLDGISHVRGDRSEPLLNLTIPALLAQTTKRVPDREAIIVPHQCIRWSYTDLTREVDALALGLLSNGVAPGDRVGIWAPNCIEWVLTQFATARIGAMLVCINPAYRMGELEYALKKVGCSTVVMAARFKGTEYLDMIRSLAPELATARPGELRAERLPILRRVVVIGEETQDGMLGFDDLRRPVDAAGKALLDDVSDRLNPSDPINIQFTSGTTGRPKGACLTHHNIVNNAHFVTQTLAFTETDKLCIPVPLYHCFGMVMGMLGCVTKGSAIVLQGEGFDPRATLDAVATERCTALYGVPTMFVQQLEMPEFDSFDLSSLRTGIMAGAPCPIEVMRQVQARMHMKDVTIAYGMTETSPVSFQSNIDDPLEQRVRSVGRIHPHVEVKIVDASGVTVPVGTQGELLTRGYSVMEGYWEDPQQTQASIDAEGWMHTGDLATLDEDGYCAITGRVKDMILRGGENIYPREIEEFLYTHPDVSQAQVFGIPDERLGEVVCAWVVLKQDSKLTPEDLRVFCKGSIAHFKVPKHIVFKDILPMTVTGKPQKFVMRDAMMQDITHS